MKKILIGMMFTMLVGVNIVTAQSTIRIALAESDEEEIVTKLTKDEKKQIKSDDKEARNLAADEEELRLAQEKTALRKDVLGYWWMYDLFAKQPSGMMYLYEYNGRVYGRTVFSYPDEKNKSLVDSHNNPIATSDYIKGNPYLMGMDMMWHLTWDDKKQRYNKGYVLDPRKKKPYLSEIWGKEDGLNMKGIVVIMGMKFGGSVIWKRATEDDLPTGVAPIGKKLVPLLHYNGDE